MLTVENLQKSYHLRPVLQGVTFDVHQSESVGIFGKNGAGKTTLLRVVARISSCDGGEVYLNGNSLLKGTPSARRGLLYIGHNPNLYPTLTGEENLQLLARWYAAQVPKENILEALERVELLHQRWDPIRYYSRGMLQRLGLAKALTIPWQIVLMDEPTAGLDESGMVLLDELVNQWQAEERSMLIVSHEREWLERFCPRVLILREGQVVQNKPFDSDKETAVAES